MIHGPSRRHRRSIRLKGYDYSQEGAYFITICTQDRVCLFGDIVDGKMRLNDKGQHVEKCWHEILVHFPNVELDEFVIMPNHVHGILVIDDIVRAKNFSPLLIEDYSS
jgi:REP element-mobilizing transposase RayT